jgi:hypothetical protein
MYRLRNNPRDQSTGGYDGRGTQKGSAVRDNIHEVMYPFLHAFRAARPLLLNLGCRRVLGHDLEQVAIRVRNQENKVDEADRFKARQYSRDVLLRLLII